MADDPTRELDELRARLADAARQEAELRERERFQRALNAITSASLSAGDLRSLLQLLADRLAGIINADGCYLTLWDENRQRVLPGAAYGPYRDTYHTVQPLPSEPTLTRHVLETGQPLVVADSANSPYLSPRIAAKFPAVSQIALPMIAGTRRLGAALLAFNVPHDFTTREIEFCTLAVNQISLAVDNQRHTDELRQSETRYRQIFEANRAVKLEQEDED